MNNKIRSKSGVKKTGDQVLQEIWRIKDDLSASYGHDVGKLFAQARRNQAKARKRTVLPARRKVG